MEAPLEGLLEAPRGGAPGGSPGGLGPQTIDHRFLKLLKFYSLWSMVCAGGSLEAPLEGLLEAPPWMGPLEGPLEGLGHRP